MITIKILNKTEIKPISDQVLEFYIPKYKHQFTTVTLENTALICLAFKNDKIIGAVRAVSDMTRHAIIVDMIVDENYRKQKIGTRLLHSIVEELKHHDVKNIGLTTEPGVRWLPGFYVKNGFEPLCKGNLYLELNS